MSLVQPPVLNNEVSLFSSVHHSNLMDKKPLERLPLPNREPGPQELPRLPPIQLHPPEASQTIQSQTENPADSGNYVFSDSINNPAPVPMPTQPPVSGSYGYYPQPLPVQAPSAAYYPPVPATHFDLSLSYPMVPASLPPGSAPPIHYHTVPAPGQCVPQYIPPLNMVPPNYPQYPLPQGIPIGNLLPSGNMAPGYPLLNPHSSRPRSVSSPILGQASPKSGSRRQRRTDEPKLVYEMLRPHECQQCGARQTPEWRRGPAECRVLCNACGLFHNKALKRKGKAEALRMLRERPRVRDERDNISTGAMARF